jgi:hypothetical protein
MQTGVRSGMFHNSTTPSSTTTHRRATAQFQSPSAHPHAPVTIAPPAPLPGLSSTFYHRVGPDRIQEPMRGRAHSSWRLAGPPLHGEAVMVHRDDCAEPCARRTSCAGRFSLTSNPEERRDLIGTRVNTNLLLALAVRVMVMCMLLVLRPNQH